MFGLSKKDFESIVNFVVDVAFDLPQRSPIIPDIDDEDFARAGEETRVSNWVQQHECDHETTVCARCISMVPGTKTGSCPTCCNDPDRKVGCGHGSNEPTGGDCKIKDTSPEPYQEGARSFIPGPYPLPDPETLKARAKVMAAEDEAVFAALNAVGRCEWCKGYTLDVLCSACQRWAEPKYSPHECWDCGKTVPVYMPEIGISQSDYEMSSGSLSWYAVLTECDGCRAYSNWEMGLDEDNLEGWTRADDPLDGDLQKDEARYFSVYGDFEGLGYNPHEHYDDPEVDLANENPDDYRVERHVGSGTFTSDSSKPHGHMCNGVQKSTPGVSCEVCSPDSPDLYNLLSIKAQRELDEEVLGGAFVKYPIEAKDYMVKCISCKGTGKALFDKRMRSQGARRASKDELLGHGIAESATKDIKIAALEIELEKAKEDAYKYRTLFGKMLYMLKEYK